MNDFSSIDQLHLQAKVRPFPHENLLVAEAYADILEQKVIENGVGVFDYKANEIIQIQGSEAIQFMQGMVTNDVQKLPIGKVQSHFICTPKGKIIFPIDIFKRSQEELLVFTELGQTRKVGGHLDQFHIREDFEMSLLTPQELRLDLIGVQCQEVLTSLGYASDSSSWKWEGKNITSFPLYQDQVTRWVNLIPQEIYFEFVETVLQMQNINFVGLQAIHDWETYLGIPHLGMDYQADFFPQETNLMNHIAYDKGCYIGQETHSRMYFRGHPNRQLVGIQTSPEVNITVNSPLFVQDQEIGKVTSLSSFTHFGIRKGIALIKYTVVQSQAPLQLSPQQTAIIQQIPLPSQRESAEN